MILLGLFLACWALSLLSFTHVLSLAGSLPLALYPYYAVAVALGWGFGILYVQRTRGFDPQLRCLSGAATRTLPMDFNGPRPALPKTARAVSPVMIGQRSGAMVLVGSVLSHRANRDFAHYTAAKHGVTDAASKYHLYKTTGSPVLVKTCRTSSLPPLRRSVLSFGVKR